MTVYAPTRRKQARSLLESVGVDRVLIDDGEIAGKVRQSLPAGIDGTVGLVGVSVLKDTLKAVRTGGVVCFTGMLSDQWTVPDFYHMDWLPNGVRLTAYSGEAADLAPATLHGFLDEVAAGRATVPIGKVYRLDQIVTAHEDMEAGRVGEREWSSWMVSRVLDGWRARATAPQPQISAESVCVCAPGLRQTQPARSTRPVSAPGMSRTRRAPPVVDGTGARCSSSRP